MRKLDTCYAIIDAASEPDVFTLLEEFDPPASCLYSEPIQSEIAELAPYLVEATPGVREWLSQRDTPWGIYVYTQATMRALRQHLRKYLMVMIPGQDKPVFWRYYDPRNVWDFLEVLTDWERFCFLGSISKIETTVCLINKISFSVLQKKYPTQHRMTNKIFKFSGEQLEQIKVITKRKYILKLKGIIIEEMIKKHLDYAFNKEDAELTAGSILSYLIEQGINDERNIEAIIRKLCYSSEFRLAMNNLDLLAVLHSDGTPGWHRANKYLYNI